jgi:hypothetical protein
LLPLYEALYWSRAAPLISNEVDRERDAHPQVKRLGCGAQRPLSFFFSRLKKIKTRGFRPPPTTYFLYMPKESRQRKGTQLPCPSGSLRSADVSGTGRNSLRSDICRSLSRKRPLRSGCVRWEELIVWPSCRKSAHRKADQEHCRSAREGSCFLSTKRCPGNEQRRSSAT